MSTALDIASWIALVAGGLLLVTSALGMLRLPDLFTRLHAAGLADTGGAALVLVGLALQTEFGLATAKLAIIGVVLFLTAPTASHAVAHSALLGGVSPEAERDKGSDP